MCEAVKVGGGFRRRCVRQEPHHVPHACVWETRNQSVEREIGDVLNVPDRYDVVVRLSNDDQVTHVSLAGHPLPQSSWQACAAAGLPMVAWEDGPDRHWYEAERAARRAQSEVKAALPGGALVSGRIYGGDGGSNIDAALVAAGALIATWESGGISHRLGAHLFDLRAALNGATIPAPKTAWLDRAPTEKEIVAHAEAHPTHTYLDHGVKRGLWLVVQAGNHPCITTLGSSEWLPKVWANCRWRPLTAEGDPAPVPGAL